MFIYLTRIGRALCHCAYADDGRTQTFQSHCCRIDHRRKLAAFASCAVFSVLWFGTIVVVVYLFWVLHTPHHFPVQRNPLL